MKRRYELTVVYSPQLSSTNLTKVEKSIESLIEKAGGKVVKKEDWGTKKLTYSIAKQTEGVYRHMLVELPPDGPAAVSREFRLMGAVLRYLLVLAGE